MRSSTLFIERPKQALVRLIEFLARPNTYTVILIAMLVLLVAGTLIVWMFEQADPAPALTSPDDSLVFMLQNVSGVGIGAKVPHSVAARYTGLFLVILAAAMRGIFVAAIVSSFVNHLLLQGKGLRRVRMEKHVIICGWNPRAQQIVKTLRHEAMAAGTPIVLLANLNENPLAEYNVKLVTGDPTRAEDLDRAGVCTARSAIVITDESDGQHHTDSTYDARAVLTVLALKSANPDIHVVAEVRDPANRYHFERARVNEMIVSAEMSEGLLARAAVNLGVACVYEDLLRLDTTPEMYLIDPPAGLVDKTFQSALFDVNQRANCILVGLMQDGHVVLCPPGSHKISAGTRLVILSNARPVLS